MAAKVDPKAFFAQFAAPSSKASSSSASSATVSSDSAASERKQTLQSKLFSKQPPKKRAKSDSGQAKATAIVVDDDSNAQESTSNESPADSKNAKSQSKPARKRKKPSTSKADEKALALKVGLPPVLGSASDPLPHTLILGSGPSDASLAAQKYYAFEHNAFWSATTGASVLNRHLCRKVLGTILGFDPSLPYEKRTAELTRHGIVLWDVLASFKRKGARAHGMNATAIELRVYVLRRQHGQRDSGAARERLRDFLRAAPNNSQYRAERRRGGGFLQEGGAERAMQDQLR